MPWLSWWWLGCSAIVYIRQPASFPAQPTNEHLIDPFDWKSCFVVFFHEWKNLQFNFSCQDLSIECNFFKWHGKVTKILHLLFHRIWKKIQIVLWTLSIPSLSKFLQNIIKYFPKLFTNMILEGVFFQTTFILEGIQFVW